MKKISAYKKLITICVVVCAIIFPSTAFAQIEDAPFIKLQDIHLYAAQGVNANLREIPGYIASFDVPFAETYLVAIGAYAPLNFDFMKRFESWELGLTSVLAKHTGLQSHIEVDGGLTLKYKNLLPDNDVLNFNIAYGMGLSYALDTPYFEKPVETDGNGKEYHQLQSFLHVDVEMFTPSSESFKILLRLHHRSGIYGLVAPPKVGSNFIGVGISVNLD